MEQPKAGHNFGGHLNVKARHVVKELKLLSNPASCARAQGSVSFRSLHMQELKQLSMPTLSPRKADGISAHPCATF